MKIYNKDKTKILEKADLSLGRLVEDKIIRIKPEILACEEKGHYETIAEYPNGGKDVRWVVDIEGREYSPEQTEVENILVYIPFTHEEQLENKKTELRNKRKPLLDAYDRYKVNILYGIEKVDTLKEQTDKELIDDWYRKILDLNEGAINNPPERIKYYL